MKGELAPDADFFRSATTTFTYRLAHGQTTVFTSTSQPKPEADRAIREMRDPSPVYSNMRALRDVEGTPGLSISKIAASHAEEIGLVMR